jgi:hypothetical protein
MVAEIEMLGRLIIGAGLLLLGYYVGREVGRSEEVRKELEQGRGEGESQAQEPTQESETPE